MLAACHCLDITFLAFSGDTAFWVDLQHSMLAWLCVACSGVCCSICACMACKKSCCCWLSSRSGCGRKTRGTARSLSQQSTAQARGTRATSLDFVPCLAALLLLGVCELHRCTICSMTHQQGCSPAARRCRQCTLCLPCCCSKIVIFAWAPVKRGFNSTNLGVCNQSRGL